MEDNKFVLGADFRKALDIIDLNCPSDYGLNCTHDDCNNTECNDCWVDALCRYDEEHKELEFDYEGDIPTRIEGILHQIDLEIDKIDSNMEEISRIAKSVAI